MELLHLFTEKYFFWPRFKSQIKTMLGKDWRGPQAVEQSLVNGLKELGVEFEINRTPTSINTACVISGVNTLRKVLVWKKQGKVKKIIAGPNLIVTPEDEGGLAQNPLIDIFLVPSAWSRDFFVSLAPNMKSKIKVWPAGVSLPINTLSPKTYDFLIYNKIGRQQLFLDIVSELKKRNFSFKVFDYGRFKQNDYFKALEQCKNLIYLSESESQGLAMFEAWARGVPTLNWERELWQHGKYSWVAPTASPYVTTENGMIFKNAQEFMAVLPKFLAANFYPREFIEQGFSWKKSAEKYLEIYRQIN